MGAAPISAVPLHADDLVRRATAGGFTFTEAFSPARRIPAHAHASYSITLVLGGAFEERYRTTNVARRQPHECAPGSVLLRPAGEVHENHLGPRGARTLSVELTPGRLGLGVKSLASLLSLALRREAALLDIGLAMSRELRNSDAATPLALESLALELLARMVRDESAGESRRSEPFRVKTDAVVPRWLADARESIHERFREQTLRVAALAAERGVHPVYFARAFRERFGVSPGEYVRRLRVEFALERVMSSSDTLAAIAHDCGYADQSHMSRHLRRRHGLSPGKLRTKR